jgi:hypothetical protein
VSSVCGHSLKQLNAIVKVNPSFQIDIDYERSTCGHGGLIMDANHFLEISCHNRYLCGISHACCMFNLALAHASFRNWCCSVESVWIIFQPSTTCAKRSLVSNLANDSLWVGGSARSKPVSSAKLNQYDGVVQRNTPRNTHLPSSSQPLQTTNGYTTSKRGQASSWGVVQLTISAAQLDN